MCVCGGAAAKLLCIASGIIYAQTGLAWLHFEVAFCLSQLTSRERERHKERKRESEWERQRERGKRICSLLLD